MTEQEQITRMRKEILEDRLNSTLDDDFRERLYDAKLVFLNKVSPFNKNVLEIPERYKGWQVKCAIELYRLQEDGNYISYSENGFNWSKITDGLSETLLSELPPPQAGVPQ